MRADSHTAGDIELDAKIALRDDANSAAGASSTEVSKEVRTVSDPENSETYNVLRL
jgi:hypothetical protein